MNGNPVKENLSELFAQASAWPVNTICLATMGKKTGLQTYGDRTRFFPLASISKLLTAYVVLKAIDDGFYSLDDQICPDIHLDHWPGRRPTIRSLLSHSAGVNFDAYTPHSSAGKRRIYSSAGFAMLAEHTHITTGIAFDEYAHNTINVPLGTRITFQGNAGHGFTACMDDLIVFAQEILNPTLISHDCLAEATRVDNPQLDGIVPGYGMHKPCPWGLGFEIHGTKTPHWLGPSMPEDVIGHFGQSGTFLWVHRSTQRSAIVLTDRAFGEWAKQRWSTFNDAIFPLL